MNKHQLNRWAHGFHHNYRGMPKVFIVGCADSPYYTLAVACKNRMEPLVQDNNEPLTFSSIESAKELLVHLGISKAYLRLQNVYEECGYNGSCEHCDMEIVLPHIR